MMLYLIEPEVAGEFGEHTRISNFDEVRKKGEHPVVDHLHFLFTGWLGDDILECTPCFIITESLARDIESSNIDGYTLEAIEASVSSEFYELYPNKSIPEFIRIIPKGTVEVKGNTYGNWSGNDICLARNSSLVISDTMLMILKEHQISNCEITPLSEL